MLTMRELRPDEVADLEEIIDSTSLSAVITAIANICTEKCDHILVNWQDKELARRYDRASLTLYVTAAKLECRHHL